MDDSENSVFPIAIRGYDRAAVDDFVHNVRIEIAELEANQTREGAVQKALDEVGFETASILQRAHEAANELTARSRAEADERIQRAQNEADQIRREADEYSAQIVVDTRALWDERLRLIDDIRQLADQVLNTADDAIERLQMPEPLVLDDADPEPTTAEAAAGGPVGVAAEPEGGQSPGAMETDDDTAAWSVGEVEAEQPGALTGAYEPTEETERYDTGAFADHSIDDETAPHRIGAVEDERPLQDGALEPDPEEESDHTVELEALPGGAGEGDEAERERSWDRERD